MAAQMLAQMSAQGGRDLLALMSPDHLQDCDLGDCDLGDLRHGGDFPNPLFRRALVEVETLACHHS